jgi:dTDP-4-dehydrorhamnose reductase
MKILVLGQKGMLGNDLMFRLAADCAAGLSGSVGLPQIEADGVKGPIYANKINLNWS